MIHTLKPSEMTAVLKPRTCARCGRDFSAAGKEYVCLGCRAPDSYAIRMKRLRETRPSPRELQIIMLVVAAHSNKEIAFQLRLSEGTVKVYLSRLFIKLGVSSRTELAASYLRAQVATLTARLEKIEGASNVEGSANEADRTAPALFQPPDAA